VLSNHAQTAPDLVTIQDVFRERGYRSAAFVSAYHLGPRMALGSVLDQLERYEAPRRVSKPWRAGETVDRTLKWMRGACRDRMFVWVHLWDPHMPYAPPSPFDRAYYHGDPRDPRHTSLERAELDWILYDLRGLRAHLAEHASAVRALKSRLHVSSRQSRALLLYPDALRRAAPDRTTFEELHAQTRPVRAHLRRTLPFHARFAAFLAGVRDVEYPRALYAGEVSYVDQELGRLVDTLTSWGLRDRLVLVVTADHGEGLGDHGIYFNHVGLWEEMVRVPFIVWAPGRLAPRVRDQPTIGLDVAPTLLRLLGIDVPPSMEGRDVLASEVPAHPLVAETVHRSQVALLHDDWKIVRTLTGFHVTEAFHRETGDIELYDLARDPEERTNLAATEPERLADMQARLDAWLATHALPPRPAATVSPADRERLRALGYVE
jgi:arylsulfatase A-like enzyme